MSPHPPKCYTVSIFGVTGSPIMLGANPIPQEDVVNMTIESQYNSTHMTTEHLFLNSEMWSMNVSDMESSVLSENATNSTFDSWPWNKNETEIILHEEFVCAFYNPDFIIYSSLCSFYIPCIFMVFLYSRIFWVSVSTYHLSKLKLGKYCFSHYPWTRSILTLFLFWAL